MLMKPFCRSCILNQIKRVSKHLNFEKKKITALINSIQKTALTLNSEGITPPQFSGKIYQLFYQYSCNNDPYKSLRKSQNDFILKNMDFFKNKIKNSKNPLKVSAFLSLTGNIIDFGSEKLPNLDNIFSIISDKDLAINDFSKFHSKLKTSKSILYLTDNAGEAVFDKLFIDEIKKFNPSVIITAGVRSQPAINDILYEDAVYIGLDKSCNLIETGSAIAGTILSETTDEFKGHYNTSDLIISKGQGNFETLESESKNILYIFKIKCRIIADFTKNEADSLIFGFSNSINRQF